MANFSFFTVFYMVYYRGIVNRTFWGFQCPWRIAEVKKVSKYGGTDWPEHVNATVLALMMLSTRAFNL
jgi:hypothetical protein